jgi:hypothetical protein
MYVFARAFIVDSSISYLQQYATMDNSSLIPYNNTQSELKVLVDNTH